MSLCALVSLGPVVGCGGTVETVEVEGGAAAGGSPGQDGSAGGLNDSGHPEAAPDVGMPDTVVPEAAPDVVVPDTGPVSCGLELIATGSMTVPAPGSAAEGPHVVAIPNGFLVGIRWYGGSDQAMLLPVSDEGDLGAPQEVIADGSSSCPTWPSQGMALAWNDDLGAAFLALSTASCGPPDVPTMTVAALDEMGATIASVSYQLPGEVRLADKHGAAASYGANSFVLAGVTSAGPAIYAFDGVAVGTDVTTIDAFPGATYAMMASTPSLSAAFAAGTEPGITLQIDTPSQSVVTTDPTQVAPFASLTAWQTRTFAVFPNAGGFNYWMDDVASGLHADDEVDSPAYGSLDVVRLREYVIVAGGLNDKVELLRFDGATDPSMTLPLMMARNLSPSTGIDGLSGFDGTSLAMAAARERVMVTWLNGTQLGYALLRCAP